MNQDKLTRFVDRIWDDEVLPILVDYIKIPNKSPEFDRDWAAHGYMDQAVDLLAGWARRKIAGFTGATLEVLRLPGRTPLIAIDIPASGNSGETVLLYGHLDKQARDGRPGPRGMVRGFRSSRTTSSMAAAAAMTAMRSSRRFHRSRPCASRGSAMPAAWC